MTLPRTIRRLSDLAGELLILPVRLYQVSLSPLFGGQCKYLPTCSNYFIEAVRTRGPLVGLVLGIWRIIRCNPFAKGGYDPVPGESTKSQASNTK
jgi:uncharacterized protein